MVSRLAWFLGLGLAALTLVSCSRDEPIVSPTEEATPSTTRITPVPIGTPCTRADGTIERCRLEVASTVWLIDATGGRVTTLYESTSDAVRFADFDDDSGEIAIGIAAEGGSDQTEAIRFSPAGVEISREPWPADANDRNNELLLLREWRPGDPICRTIDGGAEVIGRRYEGVSCGSISPDARWMAYSVDNPQPDALGRPYPGWDQWAIDLASGERWQIEAGLRDCQGDGFFRAEWSPSGRYRFFADCRDGGRVFLSDMVERTTRQIGTGLPNMRTRPDWSPVADVLIYLDSSGVAVLEDFHVGTLTSLPTLGWPARFDVSGAYAYSPPGVTVPRGNPGGPTTIFEVAAGRVAAALPGVALYQDLYINHEPLSGTGSGFVAALDEAPSCEGTLVYAGSAPVACVRGGAGAVVSPGGAYVALARKTGETGLARYPGGGSVSLNVYEIIVVDVATGVERVVAKDAIGSTHPPLAATWNDEGTHFLVNWPFAYGP
jgi:hypothetical protein